MVGVASALPQAPAFGLERGCPLGRRRTRVRIAVSAHEGADGQRLQRLRDHGDIALPEQPGDVPLTFADISAARAALGFAPATRLEDGIDAMLAAWRGDRAQATPSSAAAGAG